MSIGGYNLQPNLNPLMRPLLLSSPTQCSQSDTSSVSGNSSRLAPSPQQQQPQQQQGNQLVLPACYIHQLIIHPSIVYCVWSASLFCCLALISVRYLALTNRLLLPIVIIRNSELFGKLGLIPRYKQFYLFFWKSYTMTTTHNTYRLLLTITWSFVIVIMVITCLCRRGLVGFSSEFQTNFYFYLLSGILYYYLN